MCIRDSILVLALLSVNEKVLVLQHTYSSILGRRSNRFFKFLKLLVLILTVDQENLQGSGCVVICNLLLLLERNKIDMTIQFVTFLTVIF